MPWKVLSRSGPATRARTVGTPPASDDDLDRDMSGSMRRRSLLVRVLMVAFLVTPPITLVAEQGFTGRAVFLLPATAVFIIAMDRIIFVDVSRPGGPPRWAVALMPAVLVLAAVLLVVGQMSQLTPLALATGGAGRLSATRRSAALNVSGCAALGLGIGLWLRMSYGNLIMLVAVPLLAGILAHVTVQQSLLIRRLQQTRAELALMAVAQERLRIARDLHDLLGHSLSLITLKAELAGRLIGPDPARAASEIAELEAVARRSLTDVREAVSGYRQPSVLVELPTACRLLAAAGVRCEVQAPDACSLPPDVDALLGWTIREGTTNIVRHSGARQARITIETSEDQVRAELSDDGVGPSASRGADGGAPVTGAGLAGLAERAARLGGSLSAGAGGQGGFRLRMSVPLGVPAREPASGASPARAAT